MSATRDCPDCGATIAALATACDCGWRAKGSGKAGTSGPRHAATCTWSIAGLSCRWPVGRFDAGMTSGFCVFHRAHPSGQDAVAIARDSDGASAEDYLARAKNHAYGAPDEFGNRPESPVVAALRARLRVVATGGRFSLPNPDAEDPKGR